ncbi:hypothetical protein [Sphingomonas cavernae]|uniref:Uncharacterized protein n=1 Tax=Sphingomonas cavernae TaxID=2320861 RepID=A0A418WS63_9SPHN|nr:hypothetical protein [Sphingomonas cavernae]RJF94098.1 hypothetical protein D3876_07530 [Sphingomonas cavernae]
MSKDDAVKQAAERVLQLEAELEAEGDARTGGDELAFAREALHAWVDSVVAVVASPGVGRVTLIHSNGRESRIASPDLPFLLSKPASFETKA